MIDKEQAQGLRFIIIGAGMSGILSAIKLLDAGISNFVVYEKADRIGGTWRENTYPGLTCDVPSHSYTYTFEPNPDWTRHLPPGAEIQQYFERTTEKYGVEKHIRFNQEITHCDFRDGQWYLQKKDGEMDKADVVIAATGVLHHPTLPSIAGMKDFEGSIFHTARWDHSAPLEGKRVGIIGNGSTGVQIVSNLVHRAAKVCHFQRTPQWIMPVINSEFSEQERAAFRADQQLLRDLRNDPEYVASVELFTQAIADPDSEAMAQIEAVVLDNLEQSVQDPILKEKLRPDYRAACKRLIFSPDYYQAIQSDTAELVTDRIHCIEANGVRTTDGVLHELDVIALATGFDAGMFMRPMAITGRNGVTLEDAWQDRPTAYLSVTIPEFPNFFMLNGPNGPVGNFSLIDVAELEWGYIWQLIEKLRAKEYSEICATQNALEQFDKERIAAARKTIFGSGCKSWYLDAEGIPATWPWSMSHFEERMAKPDYTAMDMR
ncbi:MAG: NAD(P)/FAD-dependent oxidoreductase [Pseudomonadales bacterium]